MGRETNINWCDSTINPTSGCDGCELWKPGEGGTCYAGNYHQNRMANALPQLYAAKFEEVRLIPGRMRKAAAWSDLTGTDRPDKPWLNGRPRIIFIGDMGDTLSEAVPFDYLKSEIIDNVTSKQGRRHVWMWLTKRPKRLAEFSAWLMGQGIRWPENLWPGTSVTSQATIVRISSLIRVGAATRFVSAEPLLGPLDIPWLRPCTTGIGSIPGQLYDHGSDECPWPAISLFIVGCESGAKRRKSHPAEFSGIMAQCKEAGVLFFNKQMDIAGSVTDDMSQFPEHLMVREFPEVRHVQANPQG